MITDCLFSDRNKQLAS